jgi:hypothetical protein
MIFQVWPGFVALGQVHCVMMSAPRDDGGRRIVPVKGRTIYQVVLREVLDAEALCWEV